jgi:capsular polysaccharide biosynthesis protein
VGYRTVWAENGQGDRIDMTGGISSGITQSVTAPAPGNIARSVVEALFRHRNLFAATIGLALLVTVLVTVATTPTYESEMNILVRSARPDYLISPQRSTGQIMQQEVTEERINSETDVLRSKDVADVVVDPDWTGTPLAQRSDIEIRQHEKAVADFARHLTVEPMRKSNVIRVGYVTTSPRAATDTVDRLLKAFLAKQREIEHSSGASSFFAAEAARYKNELDRAQQSLAAYQQDKQSVSLGDKESTLQTQITGLEDAIRSAQVQIADGMDRQELVSVAVAERPTFSAKPYRPLVLVNLAMGLFTALFFAFGAVFFAELGRNTVATPAELEAISSVDVLATVPLVTELEPGFAMGGRSPRSPRRPFDLDGRTAPEEPTGGIGDLAGAAFEHQPGFTDSLRPAMTFGALALSPTFTELEEAEMENASREEGRRLNRATLLTYEQLATAPSNPAHPISPFCGLEVAAAPQIQLEIPVSTPVEVQPEIVAVEPQPIAAKVAEPVRSPAFIIEPVDPNHRQPNRTLSDPAMPARSRLTPSQRAQLRRPSATSESRASYVTYTIDPKTKH